MDTRRAVVIGAVVVLSGCSGQRSSTNAAVVCIAVDASAAWSLTATDTADCGAEDLAVSCDVTRDGTALRVTTETTWVRPEVYGADCEVLPTAGVDCPVPGLSDGTYTVLYAGQQLELALPEPASGCLGPDMSP